MAMADRRAEATWAGNLIEGGGTLDLVSSGVASSLPITWASRTEKADGRTSPEELIAAAHSSCYAMQLSANIAEAGGTPQSLDVTADVSRGPDSGG